MALENELPDLAEQPEDGRAPWPEINQAEADQFVYRLGLRALPVPGLPEELAIDDVKVSFVKGPLRAQVTEMRQQHRLPFRFDKRMAREWIGDRQLIAVLERSTDEQPERLDTAILAWRQRSLAAAGLLATVLDERVVGDELFEDVLLLRDGEFVGAVDMRSRVRTFLPFEVNVADQAGLDRLAEVSLDEASDVARAARLYRRAANEGPTADAYAMLWMAAECFSDHDSPSRKEIEAALDQAGLDPEGLPIHVGLLIDLRGKVQHRGTEEHERLRTAYYEMEAIVRCLIRQYAEIRGGWWVASDNPASFTDPFNAIVAELLGPGETDWHRDTLPPTAEPQALRIPRQVAKPEHDPRLTISADFNESREWVARVALDALEWVNPDAALEVKLGLPEHVPGNSFSGSNARGIWLAPERLEGWNDPQRPHVLVNLVWELYGLVGYAIAQQAGVASEHDGEVVVEAVGAWLQYTRLIIHGEYDPGQLRYPDPKDPIAVGKLAGWAAAGDDRAQAAIDQMEGRLGEVARGVTEAVRENPPCPAIALLKLT
jgi:hypothetical protein